MAHEQNERPRERQRLQIDFPRHGGGSEYYYIVHAVRRAATAVCSAGLWKRRRVSRPTLCETENVNEKIRIFLKKPTTTARIDVIFECISTCTTDRIVRCDRARRCFLLFFFTFYNTPVGRFFSDVVTGRPRAGRRRRDSENSIDMYDSSVWPHITFSHAFTVVFR